MINAPSIWYRCQFVWPDYDMMGLSLPGAPGIVVGTNGHIAWGVTNTTGDFRDLILIETDPDDPSRYRVGNDWESFDIQNVAVKVRGEADRVVESRWTRWGPIISEGPNGEPIAELSVGWQPGAVNFGLHAMADAQTVDDAIDVARNWYGPSQNVLVADADGRIGWIVSGWIPKRKGFDGRVPTSLADGVSGWDGPIAEEDRPVQINPESGFLFTANSRTVPLEASRILGNGFANPARSHRIQKRLDALEVATEVDLLELQLDEYAQDLELYRPLYLEGLRLLPETPRRNTLIEIVSKWDGQAQADSLAMAPLIDFQGELQWNVRTSLIDGFESAKTPEAQFAASAITRNAVEIALQERPPHLLRDGEKGWTSLLRDAAAHTLAEDVPLKTWGEENRSAFKHPMAMASPMIGDGFNLPSTPQSGYRGAVRVSGPTFGASARIVMSPNHLDDAILLTPGGQSGDPYSEFYTNLHQSWLDGDTSPLLPKETQRSIHIAPRND